MRFQSLFVLASLAATALAHTTVYSVWINGVDQGDGRNQYIRSPPNNNPVKDLNSGAMTCNVNNRQVGRTLSVRAGDTVTFEWHHDFRNDDIIDKSHKGPILVYIAPASGNLAGSVWTKIFHEGISNNVWAVDKLISSSSRGHHNIVIPDIPAGDYILRPEIIALHESNVAYNQNPIRGAQLYMSCIQIRVTSNGSQQLPGGVSFPGGYTYQTPGIVYNIYDKLIDHNRYPIPGVAVWSGAAGGAITRAVVVTNPGPVTPPPPPGGTNPPAPGGSVPLYGQCGGSGYTGPTTCADGGVCKASNEWYSQCVPGN